MKVAALALALLLGACRSELPPPPKIFVTLVNDSGAALCDVHMRLSRHHAAGWGTDWLDRSEAIAPRAPIRLNPLISGHELGGGRSRCRARCAICDPS